MEVSGTILKRLTCISGAGTDSQSFSLRFVSGRSVAVGGDARTQRVIRGIRVSVRRRMDSGFRDNGHIQYYQASPPPRCGGGDKQKGSAVLTTKKKLKLLKGLSEGLSMASELGLSFDSEKRILLDEVHGKLASDTAEVLLKQLEQLRAEEKEMKRQKKQEKAKLKMSRMKTAPDSESSSSSSSESSDSDCGETVDMSRLRASVALAPATVERMQSPVQEVTLLSPLSSLSQAGPTIVGNFHDVGAANHQPAEISRNDSNIGSSSVSFKVESNIATVAPQKRIEVCMGNKCKRSGAPALLQEFERVMGAEGAVVGCKCMGKCKTGPNVRVQNSVGDGLAEGLNNDSVKIPANPLYIGVSLEDVNAIVAGFFGEN